MIGLEKIKGTYESCPDFGNIYTVLKNSLTHEIDDCLLQNGYPSHLIELVWELHVGGLVGHFGRNKTTGAVKYRFYWPSLKGYVTRLADHISTSQAT